MPDTHARTPYPDAHTDLDATHLGNLATHFYTYVNGDTHMDTHTDPNTYTVVHIYRDPYGNTITFSHGHLHFAPAEGDANLDADNYRDLDTTTYRDTDSDTPKTQA